MKVEVEIRKFLEVIEMKKFSTIFFATVILLTSSICFAAKGYVQNGYWMGDKNYPVIKYYGTTGIKVANKKTVQKNYLLQPSNERVIKIETETVQLADNSSDSDAFYFKVVGNNIYFTNHNASAGMPKINWKLLDKNKYSEAWYACQIAAEVLNSSSNNQAKSQDIYCGTLTDGSKIYIVTESIKARYFRKDVTEIKCNVKTVRNGKVERIDAYEFIWNDSWTYSNGGRPVKLTENNSVAWSIFTNARKHC